jgi:hypothetical protein
MRVSWKKIEGLSEAEIMAHPVIAIAKIIR